MDTAQGISIDGYKVDYDVVPLPSGQFKIAVKTRRKDAGAKQHTWEPPNARAYGNQAEAEKNARFILKGIKHVLPDGKPFYTVA